MFNDSQKAFIGALKRVASTEDGKYVLKVLYADYVAKPSFSSDMAIMARNCAEKDLVQQLIDTSNININILEGIDE